MNCLSLFTRQASQTRDLHPTYIHEVSHPLSTAGTGPKIQSYWFVAPVDVESRVAGFEVFPHVCVYTLTTMPFGYFENCLNKVNRLIGK
jgi:hypothetical protein